MVKKIIKLKESDLIRIVKKILKEQPTDENKNIEITDCLKKSNIIFKEFDKNNIMVDIKKNIGGKETIFYKIIEIKDKNCEQIKSEIEKEKKI